MPVKQMMLLQDLIKKMMMKLEITTSRKLLQVLDQAPKPLLILVQEAILLMASVRPMMMELLDQLRKTAILELKTPHLYQKTVLGLVVAGADVDRKMFANAGATGSSGIDSGATITTLTVGVRSDNTTGSDRSDDQSVGSTDASTSEQPASAKGISEPQPEPVSREGSSADDNKASIYKRPTTAPAEPPAFQCLSLLTTQIGMTAFSAVAIKKDFIGFACS
ncbi:hypothetical protein DSO57_1000192 [Entomophthora muscae]|uniref:Uncharacterized protein n=1 Tax=Entomophthora muscae TaxID=34485 RepID=A0ACC2U838_9FUNG|nr:hypothetical protein DSO57_1000192 [Entomophthora muscae]